MSPLKQKHSKENPGTGPESDEFASVASGQTQGSVDVVHGIYAQSFPLGGMTVRRARAELSDRLNIDPEALAVVDGVEVDEDTVLAESQVLNFVKHAGEKGGYAVFHISA